MNRKESNTYLLIRNFVLEMLLYGAFLAIYFFIVLRYLGEPLYGLFHDDLQKYAFISLGLIIGQAVILDLIITFLLDRLGLDRLK